jgi:hypothetical protein
MSKDSLTYEIWQRLEDVGVQISIDVIGSTFIKSSEDRVNE